MRNKRILSIFLSLCMIIGLMPTVAFATEPTTPSALTGTEKGIFKGRYSYKQVFNCQRNPELPTVAGAEFKVSALGLPIDGRDGTYQKQFELDAVKDKVFYFKATGDIAAPFSLYIADDVNGTNEGKVLTNADRDDGNIYGLGNKGFLYVSEYVQGGSESGVGYFISTADAYEPGGKSEITYKPDTVGPIAQTEGEDYTHANETPLKKGQEQQPFAAFEASTMTLSDVTNGMKYSVDSVNGGSTWKDITVIGTETSVIISGVNTENGISVKKSGGIATNDSTEQFINVTKAATPTTATAVNPTTPGGKGSISGVSGLMEYKKSTDSTWTAITAGETTIQNFDPGTYDIRVKGAGTALASDAQTVAIKGKEPTPVATFDASTMTLSNVTNGMQYSVDGGGAWVDITGTGVDNISGVTTTNGIWVKKIAGTDTTESEIQTITITKAEAPTTATAVDLTEWRGTGSISGVTDYMEYQKSGATVWTPIAAGATTITDIVPGTYNVRFKAAGNILASEAQTVTIKDKEQTPTATFEAATMKLSNVTNGMQYSVDGGGAWTDITGTEVDNISGVTTTNGIWVKKIAGTDTTESEIQKITITKAKAPTSATAVNPTKSGETGSISGVTDYMEYQKSGATDWTAITGTTIQNLAIGTYNIRFKAIGELLTSDVQTVTIKLVVYVPSDEELSTYCKVALIQSEGGEIESSGTTIVRNGTVKLTITPDKGYAVEDVRINGRSLGAVESHKFYITEDVKVTAVFASADKNNDKKWKNPFKDVEEKDWFYDGVEYTNKNGLMEGMEKDIFGPEITLTRGMFVTVLYRMEKEPRAGVAKFDDVKNNDYFAKAIGWSDENGIAIGFSDVIFSPNENITREQMAAIIWRYAKYKGIDVRTVESKFADRAMITDYAKEAVDFCSNESIVRGRGNNLFVPQASATRAEAAAALQGLAEMMEGVGKRTY